MYVLSKELNMSYQDMNEMPFFEILKILELYKEQVEEQNKQNKEDNKRLDRQMNSMQRNYGNMNK